MREDTDISEDMAPNENSPSGQKGVVSRLVSSRKVLFSCGLALVLITAGFTAWFFLAGNGKEKNRISPPETRNEEGTLREYSETQYVFREIVTLLPFEMVPLKAGSNMRYVDMHIALETADPALVPEVNRETARIRSIVKEAAGEMTWFELRNPQGKIRMKYDLIKRINALFSRVVVQNLYFTYFIMQ